MDEIDKNTTIFVNKEKDLNIYNIEIANNSSRKKIAEMKLEKITDIRFQVKMVRFYE